VAAVEPTIQDPDQLSLPWLDRHYRRAFTHDVGHNALILYGEAALPLRTTRQAIRPQHRLDVRSGAIELLGYDLPGREYRAGDTIDLGLYWVVQAATEIEVEWRHESGALLQALRQGLAATAPEVERGNVRFTVGRLQRAGGTYFLLRWMSAGAGTETVRLPGPGILATPGLLPSHGPVHHLEVAFAQGIRLRGYDLHRSQQNGIAKAEAGEALTLDLFWEAAQPVDQSYTVFVHLVGSAHNPRTAGPLWGQHDGIPGDGLHPTQTWLPGQLVGDRHVLTIDATAPPGDYELHVGLYLPATLERLRLAESGADHVALVRVRVR
jgi:hypothetical protein